MSEALSISHRNIKMGEIPSVSLPPKVTCRKDAPCKKMCYARRMCRYTSVAKAYERNLRLYLNDPDSFFAQLKAGLFMSRFFRLHVSGDFADAEYFRRCCEVIAEVPTCTVLAFTKKYEIVNEYLNNGGIIPANFKIIFSTWGEWKPENPYNMPESAVIFRNTKVPEAWKICGGNCFSCACRGVGCWELKGGETIAFHKH